MPGHRSQEQQGRTLGQSDANDPRLRGHIEELKGIIRQAYPRAQFGPLRYADTEGLWMVEAYTDASDQYAVAELTSQREAELLVEEGMCVAMIPMPLELWSDDLSESG